MHSEVNFIHLRYHDGKGGVLPNGGMTVAYRFLLNSDMTPKVMQVAYSKCDKRDHFNKKMGRLKAACRLNSKQVINTEVPAGPFTREFEQSLAMVALAGHLDPGAVGDFLNMKTKAELAEFYGTGKRYSLNSDEELGFTEQATT